METLSFWINQTMWNPAGHKSPCIRPTPHLSMVNGYLQGAEIASKRSASLILPRYFCKVFQLWMKKTQRSAHRYLPKDRKAQKGGTKSEFSAVNAASTSIGIPIFHHFHNLSTCCYKKMKPSNSTDARKWKAGSWRDICTPVFKAALFARAKKAEATQVAMDRRMNKQKVVSIIWWNSI